MPDPFGHGASKNGGTGGIRTPMSSWLVAKAVIQLRDGPKENGGEHRNRTCFGHQGPTVLRTVSIPF